MKSFTGKSLRWEWREGVVELTLDHEPANEIRTAMLVELEKFVSVFGVLEPETSACIIASARKSVFSAGADLRELYHRAAPLPEKERLARLREFLERIHAVLNTIDASPMVMIVAVHGVCFGGGLELALACDIIIADKMARFAFPELRLGLIPGFGGIPRLKRDVGNAFVRDLLLTGRTVNAPRAQAVGLVAQLAGEGEALRIAGSAVAVHTETRGSSSGVIWRPGVIVTAEHALRRDEEIHVTLPDGRIAPATLAGRDPSTDLAILRCAEVGVAPVEHGDAAETKVGSIALVIGRTRASGAVAALGDVSLVVPERRTWAGSALAPYIRLDIGLQPTAVGGAVVDSQGRIVGVASPRFARFGAIAIPSTAVERVAETLLKKGRIPRGYLGVALQPVRLPDHLRQSLQHNEKTAAIILEVEADGPAHKAGIVIGDILISLAGQPVSRPENVQSHLQAENIGKALSAKIVRGGAVRDVTISVGDRPNGGG